MKPHHIVVGQCAEFVGRDDDGVVLVNDGAAGDVDEFMNDANVGDGRNIGETARLDSQQRCHHGLR